MFIPYSPQGHASEFATVTNLSRFGYFPAEKVMNKKVFLNQVEHKTSLSINMTINFVN